MDLEQYQKDIQELANNFSNVINEFISGVNSRNTLSVNPLDEYKNELFYTGTDIKYQYAESTTKRKKRKGSQMTEIVNLFDTGELHNSLYLIFVNGEMKIVSDNNKLPKIKEQYNDDILDFHESTSLIAVQSFDVFIEQKLNNDAIISLDFPNLKKI